MSIQYVICEETPQVPPYEAAGISQGLLKALATYLAPLLQALDERLDKRLVRTFFQGVVLILRFRDRINGLLLSELGGYLLGDDLHLSYYSAYLWKYRCSHRSWLKRGY